MDFCHTFIEYSQLRRLAVALSKFFKSYIKQKLKSTTNAALQDLDLIVEYTSCNLFYHFWWKISLYPDPAKGNLNLNGIFSFLSVNDEN